VAAARRAWRRKQRRLDPRQLVFIDETAVATNMVRRYGRAPRGQRLVCKVPFGAWTTLTFIAALAGEAPALPHALHADLVVLAQLGRALLRRSDRRRDPHRQPCFGHELVRDIKSYLADRNADPKPYVWRAQGTEILARIQRARAALAHAEAA
jgi:hypothetical protein